jgi:hypothetical protein
MIACSGTKAAESLFSVKGTPTEIRAKPCAAAGTKHTILGGMLNFGLSGGADVMPTGSYAQASVYVGNSSSFGGRRFVMHAFIVRVGLSRPTSIAPSLPWSGLTQCRVSGLWIRSL